MTKLLSPDTFHSGETWPVLDTGIPQSLLSLMTVIVDFIARGNAATSPKL